MTVLSGNSLEDSRRASALCRTAVPVAITSLIILRHGEAPVSR